MISTHKMLAESGQENHAQITDRATTQGPNTKTFFAIEETSPVTAIVDDVGGALTITDGVGFNEIGDGEVDGRMANVKSWSMSELNMTGGNWPAPGTQDYIMLIAGRSVQGESIPPGGQDEQDGNGCISWYLGRAEDGQLKIQPYYAVFSDNTLGVNIYRSSTSTPFSLADAIRIEGNDYMYAAVKRGDTLEHYSNGAITGSVNFATSKGGELLSSWRDQSAKTADFGTGHSAYGTPYKCDQSLIDLGICEVIGEDVVGLFEAIGNNVGSVANIGQDLYALLLHFFPNGSPSQSEIENGMNWMKPRWVNGDKVIYPGWMF